MQSISIRSIIPIDTTQTRCCGDMSTGSRGFPVSVTPVSPLAIMVVSCDFRLATVVVVLSGRWFLLLMFYNSGLLFNGRNRIATTDSLEWCQWFTLAVLSTVVGPNSHPSHNPLLLLLLPFIHLFLLLPSLRCDWSLRGALPCSLWANTLAC